METYTGITITQEEANRYKKLQDNFNKELGTARYLILGLTIGFAVFGFILCIMAYLVYDLSLCAV